MLQASHLRLLVLTVIQSVSLVCFFLEYVIAMGFSVFKLGSEKITSVALESFFSRADKVRSLIQDSLEFVFNVKFLESVDTTRLQKILPILNPDAALRLVSQAYKVSELDIDKDRLQSMQDTLLYGQNGKGGLKQNSELSAKAENENAAKNEEQKEQDREKREEAKAEEE